MTAAAATVARRVFGAAGLLMLVAVRESLRPSNSRTSDSSHGMSAVSGALSVPAPVAAADGTSMREWLAANVPLLGMCVVAGAAIASRIRYIVSFDGTYGSGDAHGILVRALFIRDGNLTPSPQLVMSSEVFDQPALLPAALALVAQIPGVSLHVAPLILMPALTLAAVVVLYRLLHRTLGLPIAIGASLMFALLPRWSFDSTEPDKAPIVMSFFIFALAATEAGTRDRRFLLLGGLLMAFSMLAHTTAYLFLPVLVGSYLAWHAGDIKQAVNRHAVAALAFPAAALVIYFVLARVYATAPLESSVAGADGTVLPSFVQTYVDAARNLTTGGFRDSAWSLYTTGIRNQLGTLVFSFALGGAAVAAYQIVFERRWQIAPFLLWAAFVTLAFAMQYPASSHGSRYPAYVTPVYIIFAAYFAWNLAGLAVVWRSRLIALAGGAAVAALSGYMAITYALAEDPGLRDLYASHDEVADHVASERLLDDGSGMLYLGWPSITFSLLETRPEYEDQLYTFGFGLRPLDQFDAAFIRDHDIKYFLLDHTGSDYYDSSEKVYQQLSREFVLQELATFAGRPGSYTSLYLLHPRSNHSEAELSALYAGAQSTPDGGVALRNSALCGVADGLLPGWEANGRVELVPADSPDGCGVWVVNNAEWGGIRQTVANTASGTPLTIIARLRRPGDATATTAILTAFAGSRSIGSTQAALHTGVNYVAIEMFTPLDGERIRLVVATGAGDEGDLIIDGVVARDGLARSGAAGD